MVSPVLVASSDPVVTCWLDVSIKALISLAAVALRCASVRTSAATTAKPRPCSPALAASTAAFSARILVWKEMPSMTEMISWTLAELAAMSCMVAIMPHGLAAGLGCLRRPAPSRCPVARFRCFVSRRTSAVPCWRRSAPATQPAPRCDPRSALPLASWDDAVEMASAAVWMRDTVALSCTRMVSSEAIRLLASPAVGRRLSVRLPLAISRAISWPAAARRQAGAARCA